MANKRKFEIGKATHPGRRRDQNEDSLDVFEPEDPDLLAGRGALYVVADGMGGHEAGAVASDRAVRKTIDEYYYGDPGLGLEASLERAIKVANAEIFGLASRKPDWAGMGTTIVAAVLRGENELYVANVGDSRAYRVRERDIRQMTRDHTWVAQQVDTGNLTPEAARQHARRTQLTRSLGRRPDVEVDPVAKETLQPGDSVVLCSDGLTDVVRDAEIQDIVSKYKPQEAADRLIELANHRGGPDNITAIVIHYSKDGIAALARSTGAPLRLVAGGIAALVVVLAGIWWATGLNGSGPPTATPVSIVLNEGTTSPAPEVVVTPAQPTITRPASTPTGSPPAVVPSPSTGISGPTPTLPPLPSPTDTPTPPVRITDSTPERVTPTSTVKITAITLDEPPNGQGRTGKVWLRWHVDGALGPGQLFEVKIWRLGDTNPIHTPRTTETQLEWCPGKKGNYVWQVQLINADGEPLGVSSLVWSFGWDLDCTEICEDEERASGGKVCHKECRGC